MYLYVCMPFLQQTLKIHGNSYPFSEIVNMYLPLIISGYLFPLIPVTYEEILFTFLY